MGQAESFPIIPEEDQLSRIPRELQFRPFVNEKAERLTRAEIAEFNQQGFLAGIRIFSSAEIAEHRRYFDRLLADTIARGGDSYSISTAHLTYGRVYDLLADTRITQVVSDLLGDNVIGWGSHYFCKMAGDGKAVTWHQDASYWPLTPSKTVTVWLAIDDADCENGCMRFLSGSHLHGHLEYRASRDDEGNVLNQTVVGIERFGEPYNVELRAGEISIHSDLLLHSSEANQSARRRCGLTLRYCPVDVRAHLNWNRKGVVVKGKDRSGHWANPARPADV